MKGKLDTTMRLDLSKEEMKSLLIVAIFSSSRNVETDICEDLIDILVGYLNYLDKFEESFDADKGC